MKEYDLLCELGGPDGDLRSYRSESKKDDSSLDSGALFPFHRESKPECDLAHGWHKYANFLMLDSTQRWFFFISEVSTPYSSFPLTSFPLSFLGGGSDYLVQVTDSEPLFYSTLSV